MDAKDFVYGLRRMCKYYDNGNCYKNVGVEEVESCPMLGYNCSDIDDLSDESFDIVEKWVEQHPAKTRQDEFLDHYPNAKVRIDGTLTVCPHEIDTNVECYSNVNCGDCCREYWGKAVE